MAQRWDRRWTDSVLAAVFAAGWFGTMQWALAQGWNPRAPGLYVLAGGWTAVLLLLGGRCARTAFAVTLVGYPVAWELLGPSFGLYEQLLLLPLLVVAYRVTSGGRLPASWALPPVLLVTACLPLRVLHLASAPIPTAPYYVPEPVRLADLDFSQLMFQAAVMTALVLLGRAEHRRRLTLALLETRNAELERLRLIEAGQVVAAERTRIARELHDVVAHHVTAIVLRSQAADRIAEARPAEPREAVRWIAAAGQEALSSMRRVVEVLHAPAEGTAAPRAPRAPDARLSELPDMAARVSSAGVPVSLTVGALPDLPAHVELAALRIVQESLTNVLLHAGAGRAAVDIRCADGDLLVTIDDDGRPVATRPDGAGRTGHGLPGMRARALLCGGTLRTGTGPLGGWRTRALLPLDGRAHETSGGTAALCGTGPGDR